MTESVNVAYRGASYEIGRAKDFYGLWTTGAPRSEPVVRWPATPEGWNAAWTQFVASERPETIVPVVDAPVSAADVTRRASVAAGLLGLGVVLGLIGLFPNYLGGLSLSRQTADLVPHLLELATWAASAVLIVLGGSKRSVGALLGIGISIITFGLFFADAGTAIALGAHLMGAGLILSLLGWLACAAGSVLGLWVTPTGAPGKPRARDAGVMVAAMIAAVGATVTFAPSWDSFTLRTAAGASHSLTAGNAFSNPGPVIFGNVAVMVGIVAVVVLAALWRPTRLGAALLVGALVALVGQAISALVQVAQGASPTQFGISSAEAARAGLTISSGLTPVFWIYCVFVVALIAVAVRMLVARTTPPPAVEQLAWVSG